MVDIDQKVVDIDQNVVDIDQKMAKNIHKTCKQVQSPAHSNSIKIRHIVCVSSIRQCWMDGWMDGWMDECWLIYNIVTTAIQAKGQHKDNRS
jgi:hypothetical protein